jgi:hypothetical protein
MKLTWTGVTTNIGLIGLKYNTGELLVDNEVSIEQYPLSNWLEGSSLSTSSCNSFYKIRQINTTRKPGEKSGLTSGRSANVIVDGRVGVAMKSGTSSVFSLTSQLIGSDSMRGNNNSDVGFGSMASRWVGERLRDSFSLAAFFSAISTWIFLLRPGTDFLNWI